MSEDEFWAEAAKRDLVQQFRFYLVDKESPETALSCENLARPEAINIVRILHGKRNVIRLLRRALSKRPS